MTFKESSSTTISRVLTQMTPTILMVVEAKVRFHPGLAAGSAVIGMFLQIITET
jgi:hypothetical protein